jgi:membrane protein DedA with SNARE-associated domain
MVEGELIILSASALAAAGYLSIFKVGLIAFFTTLLVDQLLFFLGRFLYKRPSKPISERFPKLYRKSKRAVILLKRYDKWFILTFRFIYGIRVISPLVIGLCCCPPARFVCLNFVSALVWATLSCSLGYVLGDAFFDAQSGELVDGSVSSIIKCVTAVIVLLFLVSLCLYKLSKRSRSKRCV